MPRDKGYVMWSGSSFLLLPFPGPVVHVLLLALDLEHSAFYPDIV